MAITLEQIYRLLESDEPNAKAVAQLGPQVLPLLKMLIAGPDVEFAMKAAYAATLINDDRAVELLKEAAKHASPLVRVAVANGIRNLTQPSAAAVVSALLDDRDIGVRKFAIKAAGASGNSALIAKLNNLSRSDPSPTLRTLASKAASEARGRRIA